MGFAQDFATGFTSGVESMSKHAMYRTLFKDKDKEEKLNLQITKELNTKFLGEYPKEAGKYKWDYVDNKHELWDMRGEEPIRVPEEEVKKIFGKSNIETMKDIPKESRIFNPETGKWGIETGLVRVPKGGSSIEGAPQAYEEVSKESYEAQLKKEQERYDVAGKPSTPEQLWSQKNAETDRGLKTINEYFAPMPKDELMNANPPLHAQQSQLNAMYNQGYLRLIPRFGPTDALNKISEINIFLSGLSPEDRTSIMPEMQRMLTTGNWRGISDVMERVGMDSIKGLGMEFPSGVTPESQVPHPLGPQPAATLPTHPQSMELPAASPEQPGELSAQDRTTIEYLKKIPQPILIKYLQKLPPPLLIKYLKELLG